VALLAAGLAVLGSGHGSDALSRAVEKLSRSLLPDEPELLTVDLAATEPDLAGLLREAAAGGQVVEIEYTTLSRNDTAVRSIEPWTVFTSLGNWYCSGFCRSAGAERVFRLDRIRRAAPTTDRFEPPEHPAMPEVRYTPSEDDVRCTIELRSPAWWVIDYYPVDVLERTEDQALIAFSAYDPLVAAGLLLRLGGEARLVDGEEVRRALLDLKTRVLARYGAEVGPWAH
jgi:proteasome accessory factor C